MVASVRMVAVIVGLVEASVVFILSVVFIVVSVVLTLTVVFIVVSVVLTLTVVFIVVSVVLTLTVVSRVVESFAVVSSVVITVNIVVFSVDIVVFIVKFCVVVSGHQVVGIIGVEGVIGIEVVVVVDATINDIITIFTHKFHHDVRKLNQNKLVVGQLLGKKSKSERKTYCYGRISSLDN